MNIIITNSGGVPIYEQIAAQVKGLILGGELHEGDALPLYPVVHGARKLCVRGGSRDDARK